ncbi:hypothetical protein C1645_880163 [Glomus cerebriforme]|uniref:Uncharacterized protein n=1 Tax=Glomus cerebriforme TaxID=658196 RepID=A0A397SN55_9GLOM|nr:hypothetical protein C1645_880163 [Glomus cerebriforme]
MDYNKEKKLRYVKSGNKWFNTKRFKGKWDDMKYFNDKEAILLNLEDKTEKELLKKLGKKNKSQVIIIDGVDSVGKSTVVENIIKQVGKEGLKDIIDNAIVIFLENKECWNNYIGRKTKKSNEGHKASYETLNEEEYGNMVKMFKEH